MLTLTSGAATSTFSVSRNGVLTYLRGKEGSICKLVWLDRDGHETGQLGDEALYEDVVFSPDGQSVAVTVRDPATGTRDIWVYEIARNLRTRLTSDPADDNFPVWAPDGRTVYFASNRGNACRPEHLPRRGRRHGRGDARLPRAAASTSCRRPARRTAVT